MTPIQITVITAGLSSPSSTKLLGERLSASVEEQLTQEGRTVEFKFIELREHAHDIMDAMLLGFPSPRLEKVFAAINESDGLIAVSPVFNASYSGLFKSFFDVLEKDALKDLPTLLGMTSGTKRHSLVLEYALKPLFGYARAKLSPTGVFSATDDFGENDLSLRIRRAAEEFTAILLLAQPRVKEDPFASPDFADLLT